jgi:hypothetical protein
MAALGGAAALFGNKNDTPAPPPVVMPQAPQPARTPGADVKVGDGVKPNTNTGTTTYQTTDETRVFGKPLGGLGKGGLGL